MVQHLPTLTGRSFQENWLATEIGKEGRSGDGGGKDEGYSGERERRN